MDKGAAKAERGYPGPTRDKPVGKQTIQVCTALSCQTSHIHAS